MLAIAALHCRRGRPASSHAVFETNKMTKRKVQHTRRGRAVGAILYSHMHACMLPAAPLCCRTAYAAAGLCRLWRPKTYHGTATCRLQHAAALAYCLLCAIILDGRPVSSYRQMLCEFFFRLIHIAPAPNGATENSEQTHSKHHGRKECREIICVPAEDPAYSISFVR